MVTALSSRAASGGRSGNVLGANDHRSCAARTSRAPRNLQTGRRRCDASFLAEFAPEIATLGRAAVEKLRAQLSSADVMIYDNYNFLVAGFSPNGRASDAVLLMALAARGVNLCFLQGANRPDPEGLLRGSGSVARNIRLASVDDLDRREVTELVSCALTRTRTF